VITVDRLLITDYSFLMRAVIQRVHSASVSVEGAVVGEIGPGLLVFLGIAHEDADEDISWLVSKVVKVRIFEDDEERMNWDVGNVDGDVLLISQFTLYGSMKKGARPSFNRSATAEIAVPLYEAFHEQLEAELGKQVPTGKFGAMMRIVADNDGPVTLILDSRERGF